MHQVICPTTQNEQHSFCGAKHSHSGVSAGRLRTNLKTQSRWLVPRLLLAVNFPSGPHSAAFSSKRFRKFHIQNRRRVNPTVSTFSRLAERDHDFNCPNPNEEPHASRVGASHPNLDGISHRKRHFWRACIRNAASSPNYLGKGGLSNFQLRTSHARRRSRRQRSSWAVRSYCFSNFAPSSRVLPARTTS